MSPIPRVMDGCVFCHLASLGLHSRPPCHPASQPLPPTSPFHPLASLNTRFFLLVTRIFTSLPRIPLPSRDHACHASLYFCCYVYSFCHLLFHLYFKLFSYLVGNVLLSLPKASLPSVVGDFGRFVGSAAGIFLIDFCNMWFWRR